MSWFPKNPSIEEIGLRPFLDESIAKHNNYGYDDFVKMVTNGLSKPAIAKMFNVGNKKTIYKWLRVYEHEAKSSATPDEKR